MNLTSKGVTLIEVMIAMIVFSSAIGLVSGIVQKGINRPFLVYGVEPWLRLVEESSNAIQNLPVGFEPSSITLKTQALNQIQKPLDLESWDLNWQLNQEAGVHIAAFSATSTTGKSFQWNIYRAFDE